MPSARSNGLSSRGNSVNGRQESQYSDESESGRQSKYKKTVINLNFYFFVFSGHGILEFSTEKAGQDVTPLNLDFGEEKRRSSTLNSITGSYKMSLNFDLQNYLFVFPLKKFLIPT